MNLQLLLDIASRANELQKEDLSELVKYSQAFPYFQLPKVLLAKFEYERTNGKEKDFLALAALTSPNRSWLKELTENKQVWSEFNRSFTLELTNLQLSQTKRKEDNFIDDLDDQLTPNPKNNVDPAQKISVLKRLGEELHDKKASEQTGNTPKKEEEEEKSSKIPESLAEEKPIEKELKTQEIEVVESEPQQKPTRKRRKAADEDLIENIRRREKKEIKDEKKKEQIDIIKAFSKKSIKLATIKEIEANHNQSDLSEKSTQINENLITESYAKLLTKQNKKMKALEIYQKLMVKFPDKSTYFADQIKNLEDN
ncbi:hypothetical protein [Mongoliitalea daihaiensis]|uniref:hypothetical protein n=1 Tax=Mongoliitalea daihaiensis TaxID=2782006 RepID=UPI001F3B188F|nr:hypothetical protein [Mongoliitalea daihaiensis]UJP63566.1 hypothetical protein IPZ59_12025 [Mongoliitalea daihaiensis]